MKHDATPRKKCLSYNLKSSVLCIIIILINFFLISGVFAQTAPYPPSQTVTGINFDFATLQEYANGSDGWAITWAEDGHQYTTWGNGGGFGGDDKDGRVSLGFGRVEGSKSNYQGYNVWGGKNTENPAQFDGKSYGIISIGGTLWMWRTGTGSGNSAYGLQELYKSTDHSASWQYAGVRFTSSDFNPSYPRFYAVTFCQFGKGYSGARDNYVYMYAPETYDNNFEVHIPGRITLIRVDKNQLEQKSAYEYFAGLDGQGNPTWTSNMDNRQPVFEDVNNGVMFTSVSYNAGLNRYFLITQQVSRFESNNGHIGVYDAPEPWGPWTTVLFENAWNTNLQTGQASVYWNFSNKWLSSNGKDFVLVYTGTSDDNWGTVEGSFVISGATQEPDISVLPMTLDYGSVIIGNSSDKTVSISNDGSQDLQVNGLSTTHSAYSVISPSVPFTIAAGGAPRDVTVRFQPQTTGTKSGNLEISSNDPDEGLVTVSLNGTGNQQTTGGAPYPQSSIIQDVSFDWSSHKEYASGSDNWPMTWADNDRQYSTWGDGYGWSGNASPKRSIGVTEIIGNRGNYSGNDVWYGDEAGSPVTTWDGKAYGIISIGGVLYLFAGPGSINTNPGNQDYFELWKSNNHGSSWTKPSGVSWNGNTDGMILPSILNFGKDYAGARDNYVYIYANGLVSKGEHNEVPGRIFLMRVHKNNIQDKGSYEYFSGTPGNPSWTTNVNNKTPVFYNADGVGWCTSGIQYFQGINRYVLFTTFNDDPNSNESSNGNLGIFEAPEPWGPWSTIYYDKLASSGAGSNSFAYYVAPKWIWNNTSFAMIFTGTGNDDSWNSIEAQFVMASGGQPDISVTPTSLDYGSVTIGNSKDKIVNISNTGSQDLQVNGLSATHSAYSVVYPSVPFTIASGGASRNVTVRFQPQTSGTLQGNLEISSNDPDEGLITVSLSGQGVNAAEPDISVTPTNLDYGSVTIGNSSDKTVNISNTGNQDLQVNGLSTTHNAYSVVSPSVPFTIASGGASKNVTVRFHPQTTGTLQGNLEISSNDPDEGLVTVSLQGDGVNSPPPPTSISISFDLSTLKEYANGSDGWAITWADDGHQYTTWGNGGGFDGSDNDGRVSLGFARVEGSKSNYQGYNVWGGKNTENPAQFDGKSYGIISIGGTLWMWRTGTGSGNSAYDLQELYKSTDHGASWQYTGVRFTSSDFSPSYPRFYGVTFCQFGRDYSGARDNYVYMYAPETYDNNFDVQTPGRITLIRVDKNQISQKSAYEYFAGLDGQGNPTWTSNIDNRQPVFEDVNNGAMFTSVSYNAGLNRYFLITQQVSRFESGNGHIGIYGAPEPWGPWTMVLFENAWNVGLQTGQASVYWNFSNKWLSSDGKDFVLVYTGTSDDNWGTVEGSFNVSSNSNNSTTIITEEPKHFDLLANYPNPFNPSTTIRFDVPDLKDEIVIGNLTIFNLLGQAVKELYNGELKSGHYEIKWDGTNMHNQDVPAGIYFARFVAGDYVKTIKMMLVR